MKFELSNGSAISARQAWHDAFVSGVGSIDIRDVLNTLGVQFSAKGADKIIMDLCDKAKIQQAIHNIRVENKIVWAWGMFAYSPIGTENQNTLINILLPFALSAVKSEQFNSFQSVECGRLAFAAVADARIEAVTDQRHRRKRSEMAAFCRCSVAHYEKHWMPIFFKMKDAARDLSAQALPPVAKVVWQIVDKKNGESGAVEDLQGSMRTKAVAA